MRLAQLLASVVFLALPAAVPAEVSDSSAPGFTVKLSTNLHAAPDVVYRKFTQNIGDWWDSSHTFSHDAHNLTLDPKPMGCFCEKTPDGGGVRHMEILYLAPGKALVMAGALGPLQSLAATGTMTITFSAADGGTKMDLTYNVAGYLAAGMNTWASPVDGMLTQQVTRFRNYVERGDAARAK